MSGGRLGLFSAVAQELDESTRIQQRGRAADVLLMTVMSLVQTAEKLKPRRPVARRRSVRLERRDRLSSWETHQT